MWKAAVDIAAQIKLLASSVLEEEEAYASLHPPGFLANEGREF